MPALHTEWTVDMLDALEDDGQRYELIDVELFVTPSPIDAMSDVARPLIATNYAVLDRRVDAAAIGAQYQVCGIAASTIATLNGSHQIST